MKIKFSEGIIVLDNKMYSNSTYSRIVIYGKLRGLTATPSPSPENPSAAKFASQGNVHVRNDAQIKFLYYPLRVNIYIRKQCLMLVLNLTTKLTIKWNKEIYVKEQYVKKSEDQTKKKDFLIKKRGGFF